MRMKNLLGLPRVADCTKPRVKKQPKSNDLDVLLATTIFTDWSESYWEPECS
jgi:hypothetical protein